MEAEAGSKLSHPVVNDHNDLQQLSVDEPAYILVPNGYVPQTYRLLRLVYEAGQVGDMAREVLELVVALDGRDMKAVKDSSDILGDIAWSLR